MSSYLIFLDFFFSNNLTTSTNKENKKLEIIKAKENTYLASLLSSKKRKRTSDNKAKDIDNKEEDKNNEDKSPISEISFKDYFKNRINIFIKDILDPKATKVYLEKDEETEYETKGYKKDNKDKDLEDFIVKEESKVKESKENKESRSKEDKESRSEN
ncbi:uncharacterized protein RAG0_16061 [Rhynchosporium agropyri]|uniref:Uncharacterized protein n=1 Tax=Rhynchosporium agropyri TaxID=914238 RepID=A0A1E1LNS5_9HELO|nr:uncharacterized protein RAG0_16061 [Rhynchosporium agropyri]